MDKIKKYQKQIINILEENAKYYKGTTNPLAVNVIADTKNNHFQLLMLGWEDKEYIFQCLFHLDIIDGKVWIQWNDTDSPIEETLLKKGIPAEHIVLGLKHPKRRKYTDFAVV